MMRTNRTLRTMRPAQMTAGAMILALPASAAALGVSPADAFTSSAPAPTPVHASVNRTHVAYGRDVVVRGTAPASDAGEAVALQFQPAGSQVWRDLNLARISHTGAFTLRTALHRSGLLRVAGAPATTARADNTAAPAAVAPPAAELTPSDVERVLVGSSFQLRHGVDGAIAGHPVTIRGRLLPAVAGRTVRLLTRRGRGWGKLAETKTGRHGGFVLHYVVPAAGAKSLRVAFGGDRDSRGSWARAGEIVGMRYAVASWYNDGGNTACGFHATYGVANKSLPCGTKVTFSYGGRTVTATVDDRGPYVAGRDYDLNQNTAAALGMGGVATVESSI